MEQIKKLVTWAAILTLSVLLIAGCGAVQKISTNVKPQEVQEDAQTAKDESKEKANDEAQGEVAQNASENNGQGMIVKSDNQVVAGDNQQVVQDLDKEINEILNTIQQMDTVEDSDLNF